MRNLQIGFCELNKFKDGKWIGVNTDAFICEEIIKKYYEKYYDKHEDSSSRRIMKK